MTKTLRKAIMKRSQLECEDFRNFVVENRSQYKKPKNFFSNKKQNNFCGKLYEKERKKFISQIKNYFGK